MGGRSGEETPNALLQSADTVLSRAFERFREFGTLAVLGATPGEIVGLVITESALLGFFAALADINLQVRRGEFICLAGPSGSGKSTLLHLIGALASPTSGKIFLEGEELSGLNRKMGALLRRREIGFVFQTFNLIPVLTVFENIEYGLLLKNVPAGARQERIHKVLDELGIVRLEKRRVTELSGGEQQRVAIARAIVGEPSLVLADEPTGNLHSATGESIIRLLQHINRSQGTTFLFSSHDPRIIAWADRVITLVDGKIQ